MSKIKNIIVKSQNSITDLRKSFDGLNCMDLIRVQISEIGKAKSEYSDYLMSNDLAASIFPFPFLGVRSSDILDQGSDEYYRMLALEIQSENLERARKATVFFLEELGLCEFTPKLID